MRDSKVTTRKPRAMPGSTNTEESEVNKLKKNNRDLAKALTEQKLIVKKLLREKNEVESKLLTLRVKYKEQSRRFQTVVNIFEDSFKYKSRALNQVLRLKQVQLENDSQLGELKSISSFEPSNHTFIPERFKLNSSLETSQTPAKAVRPMVFGITIERPTINLQRLNFDRQSISATEVMNETSQDQPVNVTVNGESSPAMSTSNPVVLLNTLPITAQPVVQLQSVDVSPTENEENEPPDNVDDGDITERYNFPSTSASTSTVENGPCRKHFPSSFMPNKQMLRGPIPTQQNLDDADSSDEESDSLIDVSMEALCEEEQSIDDLELDASICYQERSLLNTLGEENELGSPQLESEHQNISLHENVVSSATNPTNNTNPTVNMCPMELSVAEEASSATLTTSPSEPTEEPSTSSLKGPVSHNVNFINRRKSKYKKSKKTKKSDTSDNANQNETNKTVFSPKQLRKRKTNSAYKDVPINRKMRRS